MGRAPDETATGDQPKDSPAKASPRYFYRDHVKRAADIILAACGLLATLPALLAFAAIISLDGQGSPLYRQKRVGKEGCIFEIYKLRTMRSGADRDGFKTGDADGRITTFGRFLRKTKLDELPQLWNVITGSMSLVGPRPLSVEESRHLRHDLGYSTSHPGFYPRVRPGMTGLEQIYRIHPLVYSERFQWNAFYEDNLSLMQDLRILYATIFWCREVCQVALIAAALEALAIASLLAWILSR